jgi:hypothetical protein
MQGGGRLTKVVAGRARKFPEVFMCGVLSGTIGSVVDDGLLCEPHAVNALIDAFLNVVAGLCIDETVLDEQRGSGSFWQQAIGQVGSARKSANVLKQLKQPTCSNKANKTLHLFCVDRMSIAGETRLLCRLVLCHSWCLSLKFAKVIFSK